MKLKELYRFFIEQGMAQDPRGADAVRAVLERRKEEYAKLSGDKKEFYDAEMLDNPYADSRILNGTGDEDVSSFIAGIDMEAAEILLADRLRERGQKIDLVLTHHPEGRAYATFYQVMDMQADIFNGLGVPIGIAESQVGSRLRDVGRRVMGQNHFRASDAARLLNLPFMSAHTVADNQVSSFLQKTFDERQPKYVGDVLKILEEIPEYREARKNSVGPAILCGNDNNRAGRVFVDMTGGTEGPKETLEQLSRSGVGTIVGMHMSDDHFKEAERLHLRVVIAGHISSDNLGMNLLLDAAEKKFGALAVTEASGFRRVKRR